jgi:hypothetical protein
MARKAAMNPMVALACSILLSTPATAQAPIGESLGYGPPIGVEEAMAVILKGMKNGASRKHKMAFAVVEHGASKEAEQFSCPRTRCSPLLVAYSSSSTVGLSEL